MNEMEEDKARALLMAFEKDQTKFYIIPDDASVKTKASHLISTHWKSGLRTLDSIQLASALEEKNSLGLFHSYDFVLRSIAEKEGFIANEQV